VIEPGSLALVAVALLCGSFLPSFVGFGFALITVPLMAVAVGPSEAVVLSAVYGLLSNGAVAIQHRRDSDGPVVRRLVFGSVPGMALGLLVLITVPPAPLQIAISATVLLSVAVLARGWVIVDPRPGVDVAAGFVSGVLNTSVGVSGPPVIMDLHGRSLGKGPFRATLVVFFASTGLVAITLFVAAGRLDTTLLLASVLALPAWPIGSVLGGWAHRSFSEERFRTLVLWMLVLTALLTLAAATGLIGGK